MHSNNANIRVAQAHAYIAAVVEEGGSGFAERVGQLNAAPSLSASAVEVRNAEALAALVAEFVGLREQVAELSRKSSGAKPKKA